MASSTGNVISWNTEEPEGKTGKGLAWASTQTRASGTQKRGPEPASHQLQKSKAMVWETELEISKQTGTPFYHHGPDSGFQFVDAISTIWMTKGKQIRSQALKYSRFKGHFGENVKTTHEMRANTVFADHLWKNAVSRIYKKRSRPTQQQKDNPT